MCVFFACVCLLTCRNNYVQFVCFIKFLSRDLATSHSWNPLCQLHLLLLLSAISQQQLDHLTLHTYEREGAKRKRNALKQLSAKPKVMQFFKWIWLHSNVSHKLATRMPHTAVPRILHLSFSHTLLFTPPPLHEPRSSHALRDRSMWNFSTWTKIYMLKNITKKKKTEK